jgi:hypothetical protein
MQTPSCEDIAALQLNVRHLETRILDRLEQLAKQVEELKQRKGTAQASRTGGQAGVRQPRAAHKTSPRRPAKNRNPAKKL